MRMITTRRISQSFFFLLFIWLCIVATLGEQLWQLRGWPINWFLQLDPLIGLGVLLATHSVYAGLIWGVLTLVLTLVLGRFFCGWVCPLGALQQFLGWWGKRGLKTAAKIRRNQPHRAQIVKYMILLGMLGAALPGLLRFSFNTAHQAPFFFWTLFVGLLVVVAVLAYLGAVVLRWKTVVVVAGVLAAGIGLDLLFPQAHWLAVSLQTGLLDPIALMHRSVNLVLLPLVDRPLGVTSALPRWYSGAGLIGMLFLGVAFLSVRIPRFYCRFVCPLGALFGLLGRWSLWRMGKSRSVCSNCGRCEVDCEGACAPNQVIRISECVLCMNCLDTCPDQAMGYHLYPSAAGEVSLPDLTRRQLVVSVISGVTAIGMLRLGGRLDHGWESRLIRPPGALAEADLLSRCIKCGQCMRICPTNVIQPAGWQGGLEGLWTPVLDFRLGTSGCQHNCVACSQVCPTAALRPLTVAERMGIAPHDQAGPIRIGTAFVDRGRCLPWAMDTPCIVCQENCPVSPKAIFTRSVMQPVRNGQFILRSVEDHTLRVVDVGWTPDQWASGDFLVQIGTDPPIPILANSADALVLAQGPSRETASGTLLQMVIRLQQPQVDPRQCIGCGVCEHECPVQGQRAIRVSAENETRQRAHRLLL